MLAALTPCTGAASEASTSRAAAAAAAAAADALTFGGLADGPLSNGGGVALARLGPRAGLRVPLSPAAAAALALGGGGGAAASSSFASADDGDNNSNSNGGGGFFNAQMPSHLLMAGVFDGHAGHHTARQAALHLPRLVHAALVREQTALLRRGLLGRRRRNGGSPPSSPDNTPAYATTTSTTDADADPPPQCLSGIDAAADAAEAALALAFPAFDRWWADARCDPALTRHGWDESGSTAVVALLAGDRLVVANAGDSVALLVRPSGGGGGGGGAASSSPFVTRLSVEHRADNEEEAARVVSAGGRILSHLGPNGSMRHSPSPSASDADDGGGGGGGGGRGASPAVPRPRISGMSANTRYRSAAVTRALGDFAFKLPQPLLTPDPHVCSRRLEKGDDLLLLASDGVTDALSDEAAAEVALTAARRERRRLEAAVGSRRRELGAALLGGASLSSLPDAELRRALRQAVARAAADAVVREAHARGSGDDATCVAVFLDWEKTNGGRLTGRADEGVVLPSSSSRRR